MTIVQQGYPLTTYSFLFIWNVNRPCLSVVSDWSGFSKPTQPQAIPFSGRNFDYEQHLATLPQAIVFEMVEQSSCALTYVFVTNKTSSLLAP